MSEERLLLIGCGILRKEIRFLIDRNRWPLDTLFLDSSLHVDFDRLSAVLGAALARNRGRRTLVFYGCCHPLMDSILAKEHAVRTDGQNCIDMLLGRERFTRDLEKGAFFLLEDWARKWQPVLTSSFGTNKWDVIREMFQGDRSHLLAVTTPCSGDFRAAAEEAAQLVGLPLRWTEASLENLEEVLGAALERRIGVPA